MVAGLMGNLLVEVLRLAGFAFQICGILMARSELPQFAKLLERVSGNHVITPRTGTLTTDRTDEDIAGIKKKVDRGVLFALLGVILLALGEVIKWWLDSHRTG
jgi:hypothetical protein